MKIPNDDKIFELFSDIIGFKILFVINNKQKISIREVARILDVKYVLSPQIKRLEDKGLVQRSNVEKGKSIELTITEKGKSVLNIYLETFEKLKELGF